MAMLQLAMGSGAFEDLAAQGMKLILISLLDELPVKT